MKLQDFSGVKILREIIIGWLFSNSAILTNLEALNFYITEILHFLKVPINTTSEVAKIAVLELLATPKVGFT